MRLLVIAVGLVANIPVLCQTRFTLHQCGPCDNISNAVCPPSVIVILSCLEKWSQPVLEEGWDCYVRKYLSCDSISDHVLQWFTVRNFLFIVHIPQMRFYALSFYHSSFPTASTFFSRSLSLPPHPPSPPLHFSPPFFLSSYHLFFLLLPPSSLTGPSPVAVRRSCYHEDVWTCQDQRQPVNLPHKQEILWQSIEREARTERLFNTLLQ